VTAFQPKTKTFDVDCQISNGLKVTLHIERVEGLFSANWARPGSHKLPLNGFTEWNFQSAYCVVLRTWRCLIIKFQIDILFWRVSCRLVGRRQLGFEAVMDADQQREEWNTWDGWRQNEDAERRRKQVCMKKNFKKDRQLQHQQLQHD